MWVMGICVQIFQATFLPSTRDILYCYISRKIQLHHPLTVSNIPSIYPKTILWHTGKIRHTYDQHENEVGPLVFVILKHIVKLTLTLPTHKLQAIGLCWWKKYAKSIIVVDLLKVEGSQIRIKCSDATQLSNTHILVVLVGEHILITIVCLTRELTFLHWEFK